MEYNSGPSCTKSSIRRQNRLEGISNGDTLHHIFGHHSRQEMQRKKRNDQIFVLTILCKIVLRGGDALSCRPTSKFLLLRNLSNHSSSSITMTKYVRSSLFSINPKECRHGMFNAFVLSPACMVIILAVCSTIPIGTGQENPRQIGIDLCACSPRTFEFTFDFGLTCPPVNITGTNILLFCRDFRCKKKCLTSPHNAPSMIAQRHFRPQKELGFNLLRAC